MEFEGNLFLVKENLLLSGGRIYFEECVGISVIVLAQVFHDRGMENIIFINNY